MSDDRHAIAAGCRGALSLQQALAEAHRCLLCHDAPCSKGCPGGTDPATFIRQIRFYNLKGAARTVLRNNPLGGVCAYVCPSEETCVAACLRSGLDRPIDIDGLQRFAVEYGRQQGLKVLEAGPKRRERVAIIGAGPAGLTAAALLVKEGYRVTLFEARPDAGGMLRYGVPEIRLPSGALQADLEEILALGVELRSNSPMGDEECISKLFDEGYAALFVAPGHWRPIELKVPGVEFDGVSTAIDFLSASRVDRRRAGSLVEGKNVVVIGGGSVAMDVANTARELGAKRIYAIALESLVELPAQERELRQALHNDIVIKPQCQVTRILGEHGRVVGLEGCETEWIEPGKLVPQNARPVEGTEFRLRVGAVIQAIGQRMTDEAGRVVARVARLGSLVQADEERQATSLERVFAGGDIVRGNGTVVEAVGDGKRAATAIHQILSSALEVRP